MIHLGNCWILDRSLYASRRGGSQAISRKPQGEHDPCHTQPRPSPLLVSRERCLRFSPWHHSFAYSLHHDSNDTNLLHRGVQSCRISGRSVHFWGRPSMTTRSSEKGFSESQALPERVAKLEREHAELAERLARLETASGSVVDPDRGVPDSSPPEPPGAFEEEETAPPLTLPRLPEGSVALAGRTLMAVGGGFLFRALTEAGTPNVARIQQGRPDHRTYGGIPGQISDTKRFQADRSRGSPDDTDRGRAGLKERRRPSAPRTRPTHPHCPPSRSPPADPRRGRRSATPRRHRAGPRASR